MWWGTCSVKGLNKYQTFIRQPSFFDWQYGQGVGGGGGGGFDVAHTIPNKDQMGVGVGEFFLGGLSLPYLKENLENDVLTPVINTDAWAQIGCFKIGAVVDKIGGMLVS